MALTTTIYEGPIVHKRYHQKKHKFKYNVFNLLLNIDDLSGLNNKYKLFSYNRFNLFSFHDKDHGKKDGTSIKDWILEILVNCDIKISKDELKVFCLCYPRILGYVFNPISVWSVYDKKNILRLLIYEVRNTFGEDHSYVVKINNENDKLNHNRKKRFHVSPFIDLNASYNFSTNINNEKAIITIKESNNDNPILLASFNGKSKKFNDWNLLLLFFKYPLMTLKVIYGIHIQALFLWIKRVKFVPHPKNDINNISYRD